MEQYSVQFQRLLPNATVAMLCQDAEGEPKHRYPIVYISPTPYSITTE
jgi:hypothetical protein